MNGLTNEVRRDVRGATLAHEELLVGLSGLTDAAVRRPSLLPGWTVAHTLTHIARNADSHVLMLQGAQRGAVAAQYPGGLEQRNADIEAGVDRSAEQLVADVGESNARLQATWLAMTEDGWNGQGSAGFGPVAVNDLPFRRWRETVVHHADLGLGYSWRDWPADYVRIELGRLIMLWASRKPMGLTTLPATAVALSDHERAAWLLGRAAVDGLDAAGIF
ncbi:MAG TPA: maleylpyruvate isomerase family mycothiol-dependent enzyme [Ilumatobacteraceae bacterium]|nr:maleylpyruvate isomerase family mycothiol-dependent enzyme [Ilumatobacteraceae bacterium]HRB02922.1 maleylpyruvate isomerase family mycothiol-dependent enzyme [Ilumatobacteraceae bacterium]